VNNAKSYFKSPLRLMLGLAMMPLASAQPAACAVQRQLAFHCGLQFAEDSAPVPGSAWLITGGLGIGAPGRLQGFDTASGTVLHLYPRSGGDGPVAAPYRDCPGPPDAAGLSLAGVSLARVPRAGMLLYGVNAGSRAAVEVFRVSLRNRMPQVQWIGCVLLPPGTNPNAVTHLPGRSMAIVSMDDGGPDRMARHEAGTAMGRVFEWQPSQGLREIAVPGLRGGNGILATPDGRSLLVSAWSGGELWRIARRGNTPAERVTLGYLPDNLKPARDGGAWLVGQRGAVSGIARCTGAQCPADWLVAHVDQRTLRVQVRLERPGTAEFNYATSAVERAGMLYIHGRGDHRIAVIPLHEIPAAMLK
jgi:hypothetical protein